ncbi:MAG: hypothetical protein VW879_18565 [Opitutae bacterium]
MTSSVRCTWCNQNTTVKDDDFPGLCGACIKFAQAKLDLLEEGEELLPGELKALCRMDYDEDCQRLMDDRIKRVSEEIQQTWTEYQKKSRCVFEDTGVLLPQNISLMGKGELALLTSYIRNQNMANYGTKKS